MVENRARVEHAQQNDNEPTPEEVASAAAVLRRLKKGFLPYEIFLEVTRLVTTPVIELAPLRQGEDGELEVLLTKRPDDDPYWPGAWHMPGTVIRSTDEEESFSSGMDRILQGELRGKIPMVGKPVHVKTHLWTVERGSELDNVHYFETNVRDEELKDLEEAAFFPVGRLPDETMEHHKVMIKEITDAFLQAQHDTN